MMKWPVTIVLFFISWITVAQKDSTGLKDAMARLDKALLLRDEPALQSVLHKDVSYVHSNGWVQHKKDVLNDFRSGKLVYKKIGNSRVTILDIADKRATVQTNTQAEGMMGDKPFRLDLLVLQVWLKTKNGWQLYARQSAKQ